MSNYINGEWVNGQGCEFVSTNPADSTNIWYGTKSTEDDVQAACNAAQKALSSWANLSFSSRANHVLNFSKLVDARREELTQLISLESGKPRWEAATEVAAVIGKANLSIQAYQERTGEKQNITTEGTNCVRYKPHGVVAVLGPFNFPAHLSNGHIIPALLAGNTVVYKPSELTPAVAEFIMHCWHESGLPAGVINCLHGDAETAKRLLDEDIQGVYFTGSYATGVQINKQFSDRPEVILALEMGGNNPLVIDNVNNMDAAVYYALLSTYLTAGQRCTCARRMMIPDSPFGSQFLAAFVHASSTLRIGSFTDDPEPFMGPVISQTHAQAHINTQKALQQSGGKTLLPMTLLTENSGFLSPGIMDMTNVAHPIDEEIFAPFVQVYRYQDFDHALALANQTRYGLAAGLLSDNHDHYQKFYQTIHAGLINWNRPTTGAASSLPFGGTGRSGNNRPSAYFAADYCAYPIASIEQSLLSMPTQPLPGITINTAGI